MYQPPTSGSDPTTTYRAWEANYKANLPIFNPEMALLHNKDLMNTLIKEQETTKRVKKALEKSEKDNKDLKETNRKMLETNMMMDQQAKKYHQVFAFQLANYKAGHRHGYQAGLAEWAKDNNSIKKKAATELADIAELQKLQKMQ